MYEAITMLFPDRFELRLPIHIQLQMELDMDLLMELPMKLHMEIYMELHMEVDMEVHMALHMELQIASVWSPIMADSWEWTIHMCLHQNKIATSMYICGSHSAVGPGPSSVIETSKN